MKRRRVIETNSKKVLIIDLEKQTYEAKSFSDLGKYVGGIGLGLKLYETYLETDPVIFSVGALNGFFPFASKTSIVLSDEGVIEDIYVGGNLSLRIRFAGLDAIVLCGKSTEPVIIEITNSQVAFKSISTDLDSLGLPGKRSLITFEKEKVVVNDYYSTPEDFLGVTLAGKNVRAISVTGTEIYRPVNFSVYEELYRELFSRTADIRVEKGNYPSCSNCPMGCGKSKFGEIGGNVLVHSLVACHFADKIYSDIGIIFSCLNVLGYDYTHEDLENLPKLIENTLKNIS